MLSNTKKTAFCTEISSILVNFASILFYTYVNLSLETI